MTKRTIVILAAGVGSRLVPLTNILPKCLLKVIGESILERQLKAFQYLASDAKVVIVAGYRAAQVRNVSPAYCTVIENHHYDTTNNMFSLALAEPYVEGELIIVNGDVIFSPDIVGSLLGSTHPDCIAVDVDCYLEESMKVSVREDGTINAISKTLSLGSSYGTSIDLYRFSTETAHALFERIHVYMDMGDRNKWTEVAIDDLVKTVPVRAVNIHGLPWSEIDTLEDLHEAEELWR